MPFLYESYFILSCNLMQNKVLLPLTSEGILPLLLYIFLAEDD